jgi:hypothetical protein
MLSERERQTLLEIERQFLEGDPNLAAAMRRSLPGGPSSAARCAYDLVIVLAVLLTLVCFVTAQASAVSGEVAAALLAGVAVYLRCERFEHLSGR